MVTTSAWSVALLVATAVHAGFQLTVTCVVYPALADVTPESWLTYHRQHSRRIVRPVAVVYLLLVAAVGGALLSHVTAATLASSVGSALALGLTALVAAPLHHRLAAGHDSRLVTRLLVADGLRSLCAGAALAGAVVAVLG